MVRDFDAAACNNMSMAKHYRTFGIETEMPWPAQERVVEFRGRKFRLLPDSDTCARMIRVETDSELSSLDADRNTLELLSALAWSQQAGARTTIATTCSAPLNVGKGSVGIIGDGHYDYVPEPDGARAKLALALYREGLSVNLVPYQVLGFFKVINIIRDKGRQQIQWIQDNLQYVTDKEAMARLAVLQSEVGPEHEVAEYLYVSGRCAVAHAYDETNLVNPDEPEDLIRLHEDLPVIRELARVVIEREFGVQSETQFHDEHLYELQGFRDLLGEVLVARIKSGEAVPTADLPVPERLALRLRDRDAIEVFESMQAEAIEVGDGRVHVRLESACRRVEVIVALDFGAQRLVCDPLSGVRCQDDGTPAAAEKMLQWLQLYRWWFGSNGVAEVWDPTTGRRLARSQPYIGPVNSRFPHGEFEQIQREMRERVAIGEAAADR